jgi:hypothetical protein
MAMIAKEWTYKGLATEFDCDEKALAKKLAGLEPIRTNGNRKYFLMKHVWRHLQAGEGALDPQQETAKLNEARRLKVELETRVMEGELGSVSQFEGIVAEMVTNCKVRLLAIPQKAAHRVLAVTEYSEAESILKELVDEALFELAHSSDGGGEESVAAAS